MHVTFDFAIPFHGNHLGYGAYVCTTVSLIFEACSLLLQLSAARRHLSFNADCFSKPPQNLSLPDHFFLKLFGF